MYPPRATFRASSLVLTAVLFLALAGAAHAQDLTVEIIDPPTGPFDAIVGTEQDFEAVAYLDGEPLSSGQVTWEWDFDDGSDPDSDDPTTHTFTTAGQYTVSVLATYSSMSAGAEVVANQLPAIANNWDFFARPVIRNHLKNKMTWRTTGVSWITLRIRGTHTASSA